ncbi:hypothetical protein DFO55_11866 [Grimontella sp. AG753]|nr:hypothetical protein DFO55_11866 [Grimontella sp. AG753]
MQKKKLLSVVVGCIAFGLVGTASSAEFVDKVTATADLGFSESSSPLTMTITPAENLMAGDFAVSSNLASISITRPGTSPSTRLGIRWTPGVPSQQVQSSNYRWAQVSGKNNANNKIMASLWFTTPTGTAVTDPDGNYFTTTTAVSNLNATINTGTAQTINADVYPVSVDAAIYIP